MKLTRVELKDFRCFGEASFDLTMPGSKEPLDVALLVGGNGSGKSAFLQAVAGVFTGILTHYDGGLLERRDVRQGAEQATISARWNDWIGTPPVASSFQAEAVIRPQDEIAVLSSKDAAALGVWVQEVSRVAPRHSAGLIASFDVHRIRPTPYVEGPTSRAVDPRRYKGALVSSIGSPRARAIKQWLVNLDFYRAKAKADRGETFPLWGTLQHALNTLLRPYTFEGVDDNFDVLFQTPTGRVPVEMLSDGFRSVFVIIADLVLRMSLCTDRQEEALSQEGVCLIDEIDAHLHPRWQENIIPGLRAMFPNVQFIATTHSPIVVASVRPENVFRLEEEEVG